MTNPFQQGAPNVGDAIGGKYIIEERLGEGGFSWVYGARHVDIASLNVAVKVLKQRQADNPSVVRRFKREAIATAALRSQHTVRVMDYGETREGHPYLVMERVNGVPLDRVLRAHRRLRPTDVARLTLGVLRALIEAHSHGVIHRDLKPANVFVVAEQGVRHPIAKVLDFGIAKIVGASQLGGASTAEATVAGLVFCTPEYAAPELLRGTPALASDLYAAGVLMIEMLEGRPPWSLSNAVLTSAKHLGNEPVPMGPRVLGSGLAEVVARAVAKPLGRRYANATEMADALEDAYFALGVSPRSEKPLDIHRKPTSMRTEAPTKATPMVTTPDRKTDADTPHRRMEPVNSGAAMLRATRESGLMEMESDTEEVPFQDIMDAAAEIIEAEEDIDNSVVLNADTLHEESDLDQSYVDLDNLDASLREIEERIVDLHAAKNWAGLARNYRLLLRRLVDAPGREYEELRLTVLIHLAGLYDRTLHRQSEALHMYLAAVEHGATERSVQQRITGLRNSLRLAYPRRSKKHIVRPSWFDLGDIRRVFVQRRNLGDLDGAWCAAAPLVLSGQANDDEYALYHDLRPSRMGLPSRSLKDGDWQRLSSFNSTTTIRLFTAALDQHLRDMFARSLGEMGLDRERDDFAKRDRRGLVDIIEFCAEVLGVPMPGLVYDATSEGVVNANASPPALLIGDDVANERPSRSVTFKLARGIAQLRPEYYLAFGTRSPHELRLFLEGARQALISKGKFSDGQGVFFRRLIRTIPRTSRAQLAELASSLGYIDDDVVTGYLACAEGVANRAGLLICGDLRAAIKGIAADPGIGGNIADRAQSLIAFSVSDTYAKLRRDVGLSVVR